MSKNSARLRWRILGFGAFSVLAILLTIFASPRGDGWRKDSPLAELYLSIDASEINAKRWIHGKEISDACKVLGSRYVFESHERIRISLDMIEKGSTIASRYRASRDNKDRAGEAYVVNDCPSGSMLAMISFQRGLESAIVERLREYKRTASKDK